MILYAYDNFTFNSLSSGLSGEYPIDANGNTWQINYRVAARGSDTALLGVGEATPRTITVDFVINDPIPVDLWQFFDQLTGRLNPMNQSPRRKLWATRPDGTTTVWRYAVISKPPYWMEETNAVRVEFTSADPQWNKTTQRQITWLDDVTPGGAQAWGNNQPGIALPNSGQAVVQPQYRIRRAPSGNSADSGPWSLGGSVYAWSYRRTLPFTNTLTRTVSNYPVIYQIGNTASWVSGSKARLDGNDLRVIHPNGRNVQRDLWGWNEEMTWVCFVIDKLAPGETITYQLVYGNSQATSFSPLQYPTKPAFQQDTYGFGGTLAAVDASKLWIEITGNVLDYDNKYQDGALYFRTGSNAGSGMLIGSHTYNTPTAGRTRINFASAATNALATSDKIRIICSRGGTWIWNTLNNVERGTEYSRGRWYINGGEDKPNIIDWDTVPACWQPSLYYDGKDKKANARVTGTIVSADTDWYSILNAQRTWQDGPPIREEGPYDGVSFTTPFPITAYWWGVMFLNPNGIGKMMIGSRGTGGNDWREIASDTSAHNTIAAVTGLTSITGTDTLQLYHGLIPAYGDEISTDWKRDNGSATATGTTTTLTDGSKAWETNKWVGGTIRFTSGNIAGATRTLTANTGTGLTWSGAVSANVPADTKYEIINQAITANLLDGGRCTVRFDDSGLTSGPLGSEENVHDLSVKLYIGGGKDSSPLPGERRNQVRVGRVAGNEDQIVLLRSGQSENIVIDSDNRIAYEENYNTSAINRYYADPLVQWDAIDELGVVRMSQDGLPLPIGSNSCNNPNFGVNLGNWVFTNSASISYTGTVDSTLYVSSPSSCRLAITAYTGGGGNITMTNDTRLPCQAGNLLTIAAFLRTTNYANPQNMQPLLGLAFYDSGGAFISQSFQSTVSNGQAVAKWVPEAYAVQAPTNAYFYTAVVRVLIDASATTGTFVGEWINIDNVDIGSPILFVTPWKAMGGLDIRYYEGYLL
jgi:hypothetical protein